MAAYNHPEGQEAFLPGTLAYRGACKEGFFILVCSAALSATVDGSTNLVYGSTCGWLSINSGDV